MKVESKFLTRTVNALVTKVKATQPSRLTKRLYLDETNDLRVESGGNLVRGTATIEVVGGITGLATLIEGLKPSEALIFGVPRSGKGGTIACRSAARDGDLTRTRDAFDWSVGPGFMMLDYDPPSDAAPLDSQSLWNRMVEAVPAFADAPALITSSASGFVFNKATGERLRGARGAHIYVLVADARDIPRAGEALSDQLWLAGHGYYKVSSSGALLERTIVDAAVWQPERLDFAAGANCEAPLEQRRPPFLVLKADAPALDTARALPSAVGSSKVRHLKAQAREAVADERARIRQKWVEERLSSPMGDNLASDEQRLELRDQLRRAVEDGDLFGDFLLTASDGTTVSVREVLDDPDRWHGARFADPLEPDYHDDRRIAWANLRSGGKPYIWSHAHGGRRFILRRPRRVIRVMAGDLPRVIRETETHLMRAGEVYQRGGELVRVADGRIVAVTGAWLRTHCETEITFQSYNARVRDFTPTDCPRELHSRILHNRGGWPFPELTGVVRAPTLRPDGSILDKPGYDEAVKLLLLSDGSDEWPVVPEKPSGQQIEEALRRLWAPVATFPYVGPLDRAVMLAAMLTASVRPILSTAPGFLLTASTAATGKTKAAQSIAALTGTPPVVAPWARDGEEQRKSLMAALLSAPGALLIDNVVGSIDSAELCAILTSETYEDRRLGASERVTAPTRVLLLATGNNVAVVGDLSRRILPITLDHKVERPDILNFPFDPVARTREAWISLRCDALTVLRGFLAAGAPRFGEGAVGSFEMWDGLVRQCVVWLDIMGYAAADGLGDLADPADAIARNYREDPETSKLRALMAAWEDVFGDRPASIATAIGSANHGNDDGERTEAHHALHHALDEIGGEHGRLNARRIGRWIERQRGRILDGRRFEDGGVYCGTNRWVLRR